MRSLVFVFFSLLLFSAGVFSSDFSDSFEDNQEERDLELLKEDFISTPGSGKERCENRKSISDSVKCRLQLNIMQESFPEICEGISESSNCLDLFKYSYICYNLKSNYEIHQCLIDISKNNNEYSVLLLELLNRKIDDKFKNNKIPLDKATQIKTSILLLQKEIFTGKPKQELLFKMNEIENMWRSNIK